MNEEENEPTAVRAQDAWPVGLELLHETFNDFAWQKGLHQHRQELLNEMERAIRSLCRGRCADYKKIVNAILEPFLISLKGKSQRWPLLLNPLKETCAGARSHALDILLMAFTKVIVKSTGPSNWTREEIAHDLKTRVAYEGTKKSQDYWNELARIIRPFHAALMECESR